MGSNIDIMVPCAVQAVVWDMSLPNISTTMLWGESSLTCACFAPNNKFGVAAGSITGLITLWDLRKCTNSNACHAVYTTGANNSRQSIHNSAIVQLSPATDPYAPPGRKSFQMHSVDRNGLIAIWLVTEISPEDEVSLAEAVTGTTAHSEEMVGLCPGGTLCMSCLRSLAVWTSVPGVECATPSVVAFEASSSECVISLSNGYLIKNARVGLPADPPVFFASATYMSKMVRRSLVGESAESSEVNSCVETVCLCFSPFVDTLFLVGQLDGGCRLHHLERATPVISWPRFLFQKPATTLQSLCPHSELSVSDLKWSPHKPGMFFLLHSNGNLHTFDLNKTTSRPIHSCTLPTRVVLASPKLSISHGSSREDDVLAVCLGEAVLLRNLSAYAVEDGETEFFDLSKSF